MGITDARLIVETTTIDDAGWTALTAGIDCNSVTIINNSAEPMKLRTDSGEPDSQILIPGYQQYTIGGPFTASHNDNCRFRFLLGNVVVYAQSGGEGEILAVPQVYF